MDYKPIFEKSELHDYKIVCIDGEIPVHKLVLLDKSKYALDHAKDDCLSVPFSKEEVLPVVKYMYGFYGDVIGKYNVIEVADLFQLTYKHKCMDCIELYILFWQVSCSDVKSVVKLINSLDESLLTMYLPMIVIVLLAYTKVSFGMGISSDNMYLMKLPVVVLQQYLSSDFLNVDDEMNVARFLVYYEKIMEKPVPKELQSCIRREYYGRRGPAADRFRDRSIVLPRQFIGSKPRLCQLMPFTNMAKRQYKSCKTTHSVALSNHTTPGKSTDIRGIGIYPSLGKYIETDERMAVLNYILNTSMTLDTTTEYVFERKTDETTPFPSDDESDDSSIAYMSE